MELFMMIGMNMVNHYNISQKEKINMNKEQKLAIMKDRYNKLKENGKNIDSAGVLKKLARQIRNLEN